MNSNPLSVNSSRLGGCTLTGALSVTSHVSDAVSIVHGPKGCTHHNFSLLHATWLDNGQVMAPDLISTGLLETDIVFGGEKALERALVQAADRDVRVIFVLSTCIVDTIGDDVDSVCAGDYGVPVVHVPTAGFLGGNFQDGVNNALIALAETAAPCPKGGGVNIIGEMNLEYEVGENYAEVSRLLSGLGLAVNLRFVHTITYDEFSLLGAARLNILRNPALVPVGEFLQERLGTPFIASFPTGLSDTLSFIRSAADACGIDGSGAADREKGLQEEMLASFSDLRGSAVVFDSSLSDPEGTRTAEELAGMLGLSPGDGCRAGLPVTTAVGTAGIRRMLHRWRRAIHA